MNRNSNDRAIAWCRGRLYTVPDQKPRSASGVNQFRAHDQCQQPADQQKDQGRWRCYWNPDHLGNRVEAEVKRVPAFGALAAGRGAALRPRIDKGLMVMARSTVVGKGCLEPGRSPIAAAQEPQVRIPTGRVRLWPQGVLPGGSLESGLQRQGAGPAQAKSLVSFRSGPPHNPTWLAANQVPLIPNPQPVKRPSRVGVKEKRRIERLGITCC